jgi:serine/threonine protein kinase
MMQKPNQKLWSPWLRFAKPIVIVSLAIWSVLGLAAVRLGESFSSGNPARNWSVVKVLGAGGFGSAVVAQDEVTGEQAAFKIFENQNLAQKSNVAFPLIEELNRDPAAKGKFVNMEAMMPGQLGSRAVFVQKMELQSDKSLFSLIPKFYLSSKTQTPEERKVRVQALRKLAKELLEIESVLMSHDMVHNDIKPSNILMSKFDGEFTLERYLRGEMHVVLADYDTMTKGETKLSSGTIPFMALERLANPDSKTRPVFDFYSIGATLYNMAFGSTMLHDLFKEKFGMSPQQFENLSFPSLLQYLQKVAPTDIDMFIASRNPFLEAIEYGLPRERGTLSFGQMLSVLTRGDMDARGAEAADLPELADQSAKLKQQFDRSSDIDAVFSQCDALQWGKAALERTVLY